MAAKGAAGGFIVTSGSFTQEAQEFAQGRNVKLLNGPQLHALLKRASKDEKGRNPKRSLLAPLLVDWALPALRDCVRRPLRSIARRRDERKLRQRSALMLRIMMMPPKVFTSYFMRMRSPSAFEGVTCQPALNRR